MTTKKENPPHNTQNTLINPTVTKNRQTYSILVKTEQSSK